jgi:hypothetical protein
MSKTKSTKSAAAKRPNVMLSVSLTTKVEQPRRHFAGNFAGMLTYGILEDRALDDGVVNTTNLDSLLQDDPWALLYHFDLVKRCIMDMSDEAMQAAFERILPPTGFDFDEINDRLEEGSSVPSAVFVQFLYENQGFAREWLRSRLPAAKAALTRERAKLVSRTLTKLRDLGLDTSDITRQMTEQARERKAASKSKRKAK